MYLFFAAGLLKVVYCHGNHDSFLLFTVDILNETLRNELRPKFLVGIFSFFFCSLLRREIRQLIKWIGKNSNGSLPPAEILGCDAF